VTISSYTDLVTACQNWLFGRTDIVDRIPEFIALFEGKANRILFCREMEIRAMTQCIPASSTPEWVTLPFTFQTLRRVRLVNPFGPITSPGGSINKPRLKFATQQQIDDLRSRFNPPVGAPVWFALFGEEMELVPTPDQAYTLEIIYRAYLPPLGVIDPVLGTLNTTNWLLAKFPDAYLYGTLEEASPYLHDDERVPLFATRAQGAIDGINALNDQALYNSGPLVRRNSNRQGYS
jgi:hypothetical protein